jgi:ribosomal protein S18 acetylase RimI-like enzyme
MAVTLRPLTEADHPFLTALYRTTREDELATVPWDDAQKAAFIAHQFAAQHRHYAAYDHTKLDVIELDGEPIGRLYVRRVPSEIRIVDIALVPACRGGGIGTALLRALIDEAAAAGAPLRIHVEKHNPALRLYERLGFTQIEDRGVYWFLERAPGPS